jgi:hypothetical protein
VAFADVSCFDVRDARVQIDTAKNEWKSHMISKSMVMIALVFLVNGATLAQSSTSQMSETAKAGKNMKNKLYPQAQLSFSYNYNQKIGPNNGSQQNEFEFQPIFAIPIGSDLQLLLNPMLTYNQNLNYPIASKQWEPLQLSTFFAPKYYGDFYVGIGPYFQAPATNALNGSKQTGLGVSAGAFYTPGNWVVGFTMYNGWGIGSDLSGGSANALNIQPLISYTTNSGWNYNLAGEYQYGYTAGSANNQLTLSGGKTIKIAGIHWQFQIGPTYMVTNSPSSAKGWGAYFNLTTALSK